ncbi:MAG: acetylglutamate kinase [Phycisphaerales bacterium]|nr:acetylglutamate kinase [Phycisphaerales bacterium]
MHTHFHPGMKALRTAIPYIRAFEGRTFVVKLGGKLCDPGSALDNLAEQVALLTTVGIRIVLVHGGGDQLSAAEKKMGIEPRFVVGRRVTDAPTLELAKMVFAGTISTNVVAALRKYDAAAVGLSGVDGELITAVRRPPRLIDDPESGQRREVDFGHVGDIMAVRPSVLENLLANRFVPVVASLAADGQGSVFNVNADTIAARIAIELKAVKYILLTTVDGVMLDLNDHSSLQTHLDLDDLDSLVQRGVIHGGMLPKLAACGDALRGGVPRVHVVNGLTPDALLAEVFTNEGCGTLIVARRRGASTAQPALT